MTSTEGHCSYEIKLSDGSTFCCHGDHIRTRSTTVDQITTVTDIDDPLMDTGVPPAQTDDLSKETNDSPPVL